MKIKEIERAAVTLGRALQALPEEDRDLIQEARYHPETFDRHMPHGPAATSLGFLLDDLIGVLAAPASKEAAP